MIIELKIDKLEEDKAILKSEDNDMVIWPRAKLPKDVKEEPCLLLLSTAETATKRQPKIFLMKFWT